MCESREHFVNPYHFIPLTGKCKRGIVNDVGEKLLTGKMTVRISVKTPLFIPNTSSSQMEKCKDGDGTEIEHLHYDFFSYHQYKEGEKIRQDTMYEPVIPGSEVRGMIRSNYEAFTSSCISAIDVKKPLYKRTSDSYQCGLLKKTGSQFLLYKITEDKKNRWNSIAYIEYNSGEIAGIPDGSMVAYKVSSEMVNRKWMVVKIRKIWGIKDLLDGEKKGYLIKGEKGPELEGVKEKEKHYAKVFPVNAHITSRANEAMLSGESVTAFKHVLKTYGDARINKHLGMEHTGYNEYVKSWEKVQGGEQDYLPVYFSELIEKKLGYLSPAAITKEAYLTSLESILQKQGGFQPCTSIEKLCPACQLFGTILEKEKKAVASKIRFGDAKWADSKSYQECFQVKCLEELAQPKLSAVEFYLQRPEGASFWTYDYSVKNKEIIAANGKDFAKLMGRKFYWHNLNYRLPENVKKTERNKTVRLLTEGTFEETVYFERITEKQLKQLLYLLNVSGYKKESGYKLGSGKPLGLGSITMEVEQILIRETDLAKEELYVETAYEIPRMIYSEAGLDEQLKEVFELITDFHAADGYTITYPVTREQLEHVQSGLPHEEGFIWFGRNKGSEKIVKRDKTDIQENLKELPEKDFSLDCLR